MIKIGLTGGIGSGKSTVSNMLRKQGVSVIDADVIARDVMEKYIVIEDKIKSAFGEKFIDSSGNLKRREFGDYIFSNKDKKNTYEDIIMPFIKKEIFEEMNKIHEKGEKICIIDGATLIESGFYKYTDVIILVWSSRKTQIFRVKERDKLTEDQIIDRINSQMTLEEKKKYADFVLDNSNTLDETKKQLKEILDKITMNV